MESSNGFQYLIYMVSQLMLNLQFEQALTFINQQIDNKNLPNQISIQLRSIMGQALFSLNRYEQANNQFDKVLMRNSLHFLTLKRKANLLQKIEQYQDALQTYKKAASLDMENKSLKSKIKRITIKLQSINLTNQKQQDQQKPTGIVSFGSFEVIQFENDQSDAHIAIIKNQISKLSEKKPKKSILKDSGSTSKYSSSHSVKSANMQTTITLSDEKKQQSVNASQKTVEMSLKSNQILNQPIKKSLSLAQGKKKKSKSVSFGNDSAFD